jgi:hypothetical protein
MDRARLLGALLAVVVFAFLAALAFAVFAAAILGVTPS